MSTPPVMTHILLVEDNAADIDLTREVFAPIGERISLHVVRDGVQAMAYLRGETRQSGTPLPDLVLLDLNLPRKDGREVLEEIRRDPALTSMPVVVFTTSDAPEDIAQCYRSHANCYITKPLEPRHYIEAIQAVDRLWCQVARLPGRE